jgi:hypothetical protein
MAQTHRYHPRATLCHSGYPRVMIRTETRWRGMAHRSLLSIVALAALPLRHTLEFLQILAFLLFNPALCIA